MTTSMNHQRYPEIIPYNKPAVLKSPVNGIDICKCNLVPTRRALGTRLMQMCSG